MPKLKSGKCYICSKRLHRHDANRINVIVAETSDGKKVNKQAHLDCYQEIQ